MDREIWIFHQKISDSVRGNITPVTVRDEQVLPFRILFRNGSAYLLLNSLNNRPANPRPISAVPRNRVKINLAFGITGGACEFGLQFLAEYGIVVGPSPGARPSAVDEKDMKLFRFC
jgi:hypothetical protein